MRRAALLAATKPIAEGIDPPACGYPDKAFMDIMDGIYKMRELEKKIPDFYPEIDELKKQYYINYTIAMAEMQELLEKVRACANAAVETANSVK